VTVLVWLVLLVLLPATAAAQVDPLPEPAPAMPVEPFPLEGLPRLLPGPLVPLEPFPPGPPPPTVPAAPLLPDVLPLPAARFELHPRLTLSGQFSDNFNRSAVAPVDNFRTRLAPGADLLVRNARLTGRLGYTLAAVHDTAPDDIGLFHTVLGQIGWEPTPRLQLSLSHVFTQSDDPEQVDRLGLRRERRRFSRNVLSAGSSWAIANIATRQYYRLSTFSETERSTTAHTVGATASTSLYRIHPVSLGYEYLSSETSGLAATGREIRGHQVTASIGREVGPRITAGVQGAWALRTQERPDVAAATEFTRSSVSVFAAYRLPERSALSTSVGIARLDSSTAGDRTLLISTTSLAYWFARAVARLSFERGFSETFAESEDAGVVETTGLTASLSYPFTPAIRGRTALSYRMNRTTGVTGLAERDDDVLRASAALSVQLRRWLRSDLDYFYARTSSTDPLRDFAENRVTLTFLAAF
jgi:hypothetical protein